MKKCLVFIGLALLLSCSSIDCPVNNIVETVYEIHDVDGEKLSLSDSLTVTSTRKDGEEAILLNSFSGKETFNLPISYSHPEDILVFHFHHATIGVSVMDTVWLKKDDIPHFESVDCNTSFFHTLTDVRYTCNYIDSIVIKKTSVNYDNEEAHFYLYPKSSD